MRSRKIIDIGFWSSLSLFVLCALLPAEITKNVLHIKIYYLFLITALFVLLRVYFKRKTEEYPSWFIEIAPFLILFLFSSYKIAQTGRYHWGVDDAFYYSYVSSVVKDGDLDFSNQYEMSGLDQVRGAHYMEKKTPLGYAKNIYPPGLSLFWSPFFLIGQAITKALHLFGFANPANGYSNGEIQIVQIGNVFYVCAGLYFCYLFLHNFFPKWMSLLSTFVMLCATPPLYLFFNSFFLVSEPLSMALVAFLLFLTSYWQHRWNPLRAFCIGILIGAITTVRFHNGVFGLIPLVFLIASQDSIRTRLRLEAVTVAGILIGFLPQLVVWKVMYGSWFVMSEAFVKSPAILETLFSSRKGLFPWMPVIVLSIWGLVTFIRKERIWVWTLFAALLLTIYLNASQVDWWGSSSFGPRRFTPCLTIFALGLAALYAAPRRKFQFARKMTVVLLIGLCVHMNLVLTSAWYQQKLQPSHADRFSDVFQGGFDRIYNFIVYPLEFPVQLYYHLKYGIQLYHPLNEFFIGEDVFYFQQRARPLVAGPNNPFFGDGWKKDSTGRKKTLSRETTGDRCVLNLPMFFKDRPGIRMACIVKLPEGQKATLLEFYLNGTMLRSRKILKKGGDIKLHISPREYSSKVNQLVLQLRPIRESDPKVTPRLILRGISFEQL